MAKNFSHQLTQKLQQEFLDAIELKDFNLWVSCRENAKMLLKSAFKQNDPILYAHILKIIIRIVKLAYKNSQWAMIQSLFALSAKEASYIFRFIKSDHWQAFGFWLIHNDNLEIYAEELGDHFKKSILPFQQQVTKIMAGNGKAQDALLCIPPKVPQKIVDFTSPELNFIFKDIQLWLLHAFSQNSPNLFASFIHLKVKSIADNIKLFHLKQKNEILATLEISYTKYDLLDQFCQEDHIPLLSWFFITAHLAEIAVSYDIQTSDLCSFKHAVLHELTLITKKPCIRSTEELYKLFIESLNAEKLEKSALFLVEIYAHMIEQFQSAKDTNMEMFAKFIHSALQSITESLKVSNKQQELSKILEQLFDYDPEAHTLPKLTGHRLVDIALHIFPCDLFVSIGRWCNMPQNKAIQSARAFYQSLVSLCNVPGPFECPDYLKMVSSLTENDPRFDIELKAIANEFLAKLKFAFNVRDKILYGKLLILLVSWIEKRLEQGKFQHILVYTEVNPNIIPKLLHSIEIKDHKNTLKTIIDYSLRILVADECIHDFELINMFKSAFRKKKASTDRNNEFIEFQKILYQHFEISVEKNLGKIINEPFVYHPTLSLNSHESALKKSFDIKAYKDKLYKVLTNSEFKTQVELGHDLFKEFTLSLEESKIEDSQKMIRAWFDILIKCYQEKKYKPLILLMNILTSSKFTQEDSLYPRLQYEHVLFLLRMLEIQNYKAAYFLIIVNLDLRALYNYEISKNIIEIKKKLINEYCSDLNIFALSQYDNIIKQYAAHLFSLKSQRLCDKTTHTLNNQYFKILTQSLLLQSLGLDEKARKARTILADFIHKFALETKTCENFGKYAFIKTLYYLSQEERELIMVLLKTAPHRATSLLCWLQVNFSLFTQFMQDLNITTQEFCQLKNYLYDKICTKLDRSELLRSPEEICADLDLLDKQPKAEEELIRILALELKFYFMECFQARDFQNFAAALTTTVHSLKAKLNNKALLSLFLNFKGNKIEQFILAVLKEESHPQLSLRIFLDQLKTEQWTSYHQLIGKEPIEFFKQLYQFMQTDNRSLLRQEPDALLKGRLEIFAQNKNTNLGDQKLSLIRFEISLLFADAFMREDYPLFAHLVLYVRNFMLHLYRQGQELTLIQFFKLQSATLERTQNEEELLIRTEQNMVLESIMNRLEANDPEGLMHYLLTYYSSHYKKMNFGYIDNSKYKEAAYKILDISPINLHNLGEIEIVRDKALIVDRIRQFSQNKVEVSRYKSEFNRLAKTPSIIFSMAQPTKSEIGYTAVFKSMRKTWIEHLVAHRFGVMDDELEGSFSLTMVSELISSFSDFAQDPSHSQNLAETKQILAGLSDNLWLRFKDKLIQDIQNICICQDQQKLTQSLRNKETIAIPVRFYSDHDGVLAWGHYTAAVFFYYRGSSYCILSDRGGLISSEHFGFVLHKIGNSEHFESVVSALNNSNLTAMKLGEFKQLMEKLELKLFYKINKKKQKSGNCGFSSCAKMLLFSIVFTNNLLTMEAHSDTKKSQSHGSETKIEPKVDSKNFSPEPTPSELSEFSLAERASRPTYKGFTLFDRVHIIKRYFSECDKYDLSPNLNLLAQILLKCEHRAARSEIVKLIQDKDLIKPIHRQEAYHTLLKQAEWMIMAEIELVEKTDSLKINNGFLQEYAKKILDAYLGNHGDKVIQELISQAVLHFDKIHADIDYKAKQRRNK